MAHGKNKYQSRENRSLIQKVLMREWDPIGVEGIAGAENEYDGYVGTVYTMLVDGHATTQAIVDFLLKAVAVDMALSPTPEITQRCIQTAKTLIELRQKLLTH